jgi:hypothetical protein
LTVNRSPSSSNGPTHPSAEESDERALGFVRRELGDFDVERTEVLGGEVVVSRAMATLLEPAHA